MRDKEIDITKDNPNINWEKAIVVIDGLSMAVVLSIIAKNKMIGTCIVEDSIFEDKDGLLSDNIQTRILLDLIITNLNIKNLYRFNVHNNRRDDIKTIIGWKQIFRTKREEIRFIKYLEEDQQINFKEVEFVGAITSAFIRYLPFDNPKITYIDHGTEICARMTKKLYPSSKFKTKIKKILGISNLFQKNFKQGYTLAYHFDDHYKHIDYRAFENPIIELYMKPIIEQLKKKRIVLFLPLLKEHLACVEKDRLESSQNFKRLDFESIYRKILNKYVLPNEIVIIKHHPMALLYLSAEEVLKSTNAIKKILYENEVYNIDEIIENNIYQYLSAELLVKYLPIIKVIGMGSTALMNMAHNKNLKCISCVNDLIKGCPELTEYHMDEEINRD
ncbi:MAG: hypothetical protein ACRC76_01910, partial [Proteocatella sp.]